MQSRTEGANKFTEQEGKFAMTYSSQCRDRKSRYIYVRGDYLCLSKNRGQNADA